MSVDETRCDVEAADIGHRRGFCGIDTLAHRRDFSVGDRDVPDGIHLVARIDDVSAFEQELIPDLCTGAWTADNDDEENRPEPDTRIRHDAGKYTIRDIA
jgi:hypothetical protein